MESYSDSKFLFTKGVDKTEYYEHDEAVEICRKRNEEMLEELKQKMEKHERNNNVAAS